MGYGAWFKRYAPQILKALLLDPKVLLSIAILILMFSLPTLTSLIIVPSLMSSITITHFIKQLHMSFMNDVLTMLRVIGLKSNVEAVKTLTALLRMILCYLLYSLLVLTICRSMNIEFSVTHFILYSTIYLAVTTILLTAFSLKGLIVGDESLPDWKI